MLYQTGVLIFRDVRTSLSLMYDDDNNNSNGGDMLVSPLPRTPAITSTASAAEGGGRGGERDQIGGRRIDHQGIEEESQHGLIVSHQQGHDQNHEFGGDMVLNATTIVTMPMVDEQQQNGSSIPIGNTNTTSKPATPTPRSSSTSWKEEDSKNQNHNDANFIVDIISVGSKTRTEYTQAQRETFGMHPSVRNFFVVDESDDVETDCDTVLNVDDVVAISRSCRKKQWIFDMYGTKYFRPKALKKKASPVGWICAQKRPISGLIKVLEHYSGPAAAVTLPDFLIIIDDDTYYNMELFTNDFAVKANYASRTPGLGIEQQQHEEEEEPLVIAGCTLSSGRFYFGGYGIFFNKASIRRMIEPINCNHGSKGKRDGDLDGEKDGIDSRNHTWCAQLEANLIGEADGFESGHTLKDILKQIVESQLYKDYKAWTKGYCFHSDWVLPFFANYYNLSSHAKIPGRMQHWEAPESTVKDGHPRAGICYYGDELPCDPQARICHYVAPDDMRKLWSKSRERNDKQMNRTFVEPTMTQETTVTLDEGITSNNSSGNESVNSVNTIGHKKEVGLIIDDDHKNTSDLALLNYGQNETHHYPYVRPRRFSTNTQLNIDRGLNIINCWSAQRIAAWIYEGQRNDNKRRRTWRLSGGRGREEPVQKLLGGRIHGASSSPTKSIRQNDTIFVSHWVLKEFVEDFLPLIKVDIVIISTAFHMSYPQWVGPHYGRSITEHPHVLKWFTTDIANYTGGMQDHPKVSSFPIGLKPDRPGSKKDYRSPLQSYRTAFLRYHNNVRNASNTSTKITQERRRRRKQIKIFAGPLGDTTPKRKGVPATKEKMNYTHYLEELAGSQYVLSPDGDHPDCHRHYEAIGLGTVPITQLDPNYYSHLEEGNIVYSNNDWNLTSLQETLPTVVVDDDDDEEKAMRQTIPLSAAADTVASKIPTKGKKPNQNMIFEEYWMEYVEQKSGRPLRWWDALQNKAVTLDNFVTATTMSAPLFEQSQ